MPHIAFVFLANLDFIFRYFPSRNVHSASPSYNAVSGIYNLKYNGMDAPTRVTQQMFETITGPILSYCTDKKNYDMISWTNFGEWLEQNIDEYVRVENTHG